MNSVVPIALFVYARPNHLQQTLERLRTNQVPLIYAFSDGPRTPDKEPAVAAVREILRTIDWCEVVLCEREENLGLGKSILTGVTSVLSKHEAIIVFEDDLICVPGTYQYLCAALDAYRDNFSVMSVTGWTHPSVTPSNVIEQPYFDGRAECWVWGTWARVWQDMDKDANTLMQMCEALGIDVYSYGEDLPAMAAVEIQQNIWAVRFLYLHLLHKGLCLRPPHSMVEHIGFDSQATNASDGSQWSNPPLKACPALPEEWPDSIEHPECAHLWQMTCGTKPVPPEPVSLPRYAVRLVRQAISKVKRQLKAKV
jgi:hypothetical protein